jgi:hypothetical protein
MSPALWAIFWALVGGLAVYVGLGLYFWRHLR